LDNYLFELWTLFGGLIFVTIISGHDND